MNAPEGWHIAHARGLRLELMAADLLGPGLGLPAGAVLMDPTTLFRFDCTEPSSEIANPCQILEHHKYTLYPIDAIVFPAVKTVVLYLEPGALDGNVIRVCGRHAERKIWTAEQYFVFRQGWDMALAYADASRRGVVIHP
jgi:hypothetical protein